MNERLKPLISVMLPVHNGGSHLEACLESICASRYPRLEVCVIDDGSTDGSADLLDSWAGRDDRIRLSLREHRGRNATRNELIAMTRGEILAAQDQDDLSHHRRFEVIAASYASESWDIFHSRSFLVSARNEITVATLRLRPARYFLRGSHNFLVHGSAALTRRLIEQVGGYRDVAAEDLDLWLRCLRAGANFRYWPTPLYAYRLHGDVDSGTSAAQLMSSAKQLAEIRSVIPRPRDFDAYRAAKIACYNGASLRPVIRLHPLWAVRIAVTQSTERREAKRHRDSATGFPALGWGA